MTAVMTKPIVYLGPSLPSQTAQTLLPGCELRLPIRRGDLYRDREQGGALFVILDGVLIQEPAVPPREIIDVLQDGATVIGAASMGALRAAECWPAGMQGVGTIYRLFRQGRLHSDDEVILTFAPPNDDVDDDHDPYRPLSLALINIRYALRRAVRRRRLLVEQAGRIVRHAETLHFSERRWPVLLAQTGIQDDSLCAFLEAQDLKQIDAIRALRTVARRLEAGAYALSPRPSAEIFIPSEAQREQVYDAMAGFDPATLQHELARWHLISGRYTRYVAAIAAANPELALSERLARKRELNAVLTGLAPIDPLLAEQSGEQAHSAALRWVLTELWKELGSEKSGFAASLWAELNASGELSAELFRWRAITTAAIEAARRGLQPRRQDIFLAESEIAHEHGFQSWRLLRQSMPSAPYPWAEFTACRDQLALAKRLREDLFNPHSSSCGNIKP